MAVAARSGGPGPSDARVPCPQCGGLIHPIAGRCKHCKADLGAYRAARPAAAAPLPPLHARPDRASPPQAVPIATAAAESQPVLPPRPTGRMPTTGAQTSAWQVWPIVVIGIALLAITGAGFLMFWPRAKTDDGVRNGTHVLQPPPAPERMDTDPLPPHPPVPQSADPWAQPHAQLDPPRHATPDPVPDDPSVDDPFAMGGGHTGSLGIGGSFGTGNSFMVTLVRHACDRMKQCGSVDSTMRMSCAMITRSFPAQPPPSCPAAQRCLAHIDQLDCGGAYADFSAFATLLTQFSDCSDAISC